MDTNLARYPQTAILNEMRKAEIKLYGITAGWLTQDEEGYRFEYDTFYTSLRRVLCMFNGYV